MINNQRGFILLDMTLGLFVLMLTMSLLISTFSFGFKAWQNIQSEIILTENEKVIFDWLVHDISLNTKELTIVNENTILLTEIYPQKRTMFYLAMSPDYKQNTMFVSRQIIGLQSGVNQISDPNQVAMESIFFEKLSGQALRVKIIARTLKYPRTRTMEQIIFLHNGSIL